MTWGDLRFSLQTAAPGVSLDLIDSYLNSRYEQVLEHMDWSGLRGQANIVTTAAWQSSTDSVALTVGSAAVTGTGTSWTKALVGMKFYRPGDTAIYRVGNVLGATVLTLDRPYEGNGIDATETSYPSEAYVLMQNVYQLPNDCSSIVSAIDPVTGFPMLGFSKEEADQSWGPRTLVQDPESWAPYYDTDEIMPPVLHRIEFFPPPVHARGITVEYRRAKLRFDGGNTAASPLPFVTDSVLLYGCRADIAAYLKDWNAAKDHEAKFQEQLARMALKEESQVKLKRRIRMAPRFTRHRMERASRGLNNYWGPGQGGPN